MELKQLNKHQFDRFCEFIYRTSGIRIAENKQTLLSNRIRRRLRDGQDFEAYYEYLTSPRGGEEVSGFIDAITTNETFFFRTESHFDWIENGLIPEVVAAAQQGRRSKSLRFWSAGCATGAEPYTIAICMLENLRHLHGWSIEILGTDISDEALAAARTGCFRPRALGAVSEIQLKKFFKLADDGASHRVRDQVRTLVRFEHHNLLMPIQDEPFDCVFIRNVLIYFDRASKRRVVANLIDALAPGGYLVVGPSEGVYDMLEPLERCATFLYRKPMRHD